MHGSNNMKGKKEGESTDAVGKKGRLVWHFRFRRREASWNGGVWSSSFS